MQDKISGDDWSQWVNSPVTKAVVAYLQDAQNRAVEQMLNLDVGVDLNLQQYAVRSMSLRYFVDGLGQATDLEDLKDALVQEEGDER